MVRNQTRLTHLSIGSGYHNRAAAATAQWPSSPPFCLHDHTDHTSNLLKSPLHCVSQERSGKPSSTGSSTMGTLSPRQQIVRIELLHLCWAIRHRKLAWRFFTSFGWTDITAHCARTSWLYNLGLCGLWHLRNCNLRHQHSNLWRAAAASQLQPETTKNGIQTNTWKNQKVPQQ